MDNNHKMQGKVCLVTGATSGIGVEAARALAEQGAQVVVVGRSRERCERTVAAINGGAGARVERAAGLLADLGSPAEVRRLAAEFLDRYPRLDVLVNNAGVFNWSRQENAAGLEATWAVNHLNYFLLTILLLDRLKETAAAQGEARVVNVSSGAHRGGRINFDDLQGKQRYSGWPAYAQSKLANLLFTFELARRLGGSGVTANALHPGFVATNFALNNGLLARLVLPIIHRFALTPAEGARTVVYLASSPEVRGVSGEYFEDCRPVRAASAAYDLETARRLWQVSEAMVA